MEDDDGLREILEVQMRQEGYETRSVRSAEDAFPILQTYAHQLVITDLNLPGASGIDLLKWIRAEHPETAVIVSTAFATVKTAVEAMKTGAYDYVTKPVQPYAMKALVKRATEHWRLVDHVQVLRTSLDRKGGFEEIIGSSPSLLQALDVAARTASTDATMLIYGETGTGKELVAKALHFLSPRSEHPFVTINCGSIPSELLESELFGHVKGSFTGAFGHKKGKVEMAEGGTVFLDEIGEMPWELQVRILRLIQEREIEKVGGAAPIKVNVRIIAATHRDLLAMTKAGEFREDLYYRLLVVPINLPPLRERPGDIPALTQHFFVKFRLKYGRADLVLPSKIIDLFEQYNWPGNIRQLQNAMERVVLLSEGPEITISDLPAFLTGDFDPLKMPSDLGDELGVASDELGIAGMEKALILRTLKECGGNQTHAAQILKMTRRALGYRLKRYHLQDKNSTQSEDKTSTQSGA